MHLLRDDQTEKSALQDWCVILIGESGKMHRLGRYGREFSTMRFLADEWRNSKSCTERGTRRALGLSGMRERPERIGAKLRVLSGVSAGTEIELPVPVNIAFEFSPSASRWEWLSKLKFRMAREEARKAESERLQ